MININLSGEEEMLAIKVIENEGIEMLEQFANEMEAKYGLGVEPIADHDLDFREDCYQQDRDNQLAESQMLNAVEYR